MIFKPTRIYSYVKEAWAQLFDDTQNELRTQLLEVTPVVRTFGNATAGALTYNLPDGAANPNKDYLYIKTDSSGNTVTILPFGTQTINGASSFVLAAQYDQLLVCWVPSLQSWVQIVP